MLVQGTAAEVLKAAMLRAHRTDPTSRHWTLLFPLHDELVFAVDTLHLQASAISLAAAMRLAGDDVAALCGVAGGFRVPLEVQCKTGLAFGSLTPLAIDVIE
jgi:DNA polymerase I-like protein with 3'-5' exonuclease and polymerase domains